MVTDTDIKHTDVSSKLEFEFQPFDPEKISILSKTVSMDKCLGRLEQGTITLAPDFQRNEVWSMEKKCRLIESLMLRIPIPMFYVAADERENYAVVDGLQRLSAIRDFILGEKYLETREERYKGEGFKLKHLEFWGNQYNGLIFNELPINIKNRILETEFTFTIINPKTPEEVKRNVFRRINDGVPLNSQEIRHALYTGKSTYLLQRLSQKEVFLIATDNSLKPKRMQDKEFIIRLLAFLIRSYDKYPTNGDMDKFLSDTMRIINVFGDLEGREAQRLFRGQEKLRAEDILISSEAYLEELFEKAMIRAYEIFGEHTFRKSHEGKRRTPVNKSLFEVWGVLLSQITHEEFINLKNNRQSFLAEFTEKYLKNEAFSHIISRDGLKPKSVGERHKHLKTLLNQFIHA